MNDNEKDWLGAIIFAIVLVIVTLCIIFAGSCKTTRTAAVNDTGGLFLQHQNEIDRLEEELRNRDRTIENAIRELGAITSRSSSLEGSIDDIICLFEEYQRRVERLLQDYYAVRTGVGDTQSEIKE